MTRLTPNRIAISRCGSPPGTTAKAGRPCPSIAQAPAQSLPPTIDAGDPVVDPVLDRLDPQRPGVPAPGKVVQQVEGFGQHVIGRDRHQRRHLDPGHQTAQPLRRSRCAADRAGGLVIGVARVEQDRPAGFEVAVDPLDRLRRGRRLASEPPANRAAERRSARPARYRRRAARPFRRRCAGSTSPVSPMRPARLTASTSWFPVRI